MSIWGKSARSWRRKNSRAVSPIIATILLVAITVVLAAVLYILVSQYTKTGAGATPISLGFSGGGNNVKVGALYYDNLTLSPSSTSLTTGMFGLKISTVTGGLVAGWTAKLINSSGATVATFTQSTGSWDNTVGVTNGEELAVSGSSAFATGDSISAFGVNGASVSGSGSM